MTIHGAAGCWHNFHNQIRSFSATHRVVAPDLRGHGLSPWPGPSSIQDFVDDLKWLVEAEIPGDFSIFSHSFGGCLATHLTVQLEHRVNRLALLNTGGHIPRGFVYRLLQLLCGKADTYRKVQPYAVACSSEVAQYLLYRTLKGWNCWEDFPRIQCPTLVVLGRKDVLIPVEYGIRLARVLPNPSVHILRSGHVSMWEDPHVLFDLLQRLMGSGAAAAQSA